MAGSALAVAASALFISSSASASTHPIKTVDHWGAYISGGQADQDPLSTPTPITLPGQVVQVASSNAANYALLSTGAVYAWGIGDNGELGDGGTT
ncbi:MAG: hypothetical protein JO368_05940, partial [Acidimicrobiales bacterium]|nr:hypothetical protein [Acidimicrobiales bacterium]